MKIMQFIKSVVKTISLAYRPHEIFVIECMIARQSRDAAEHYVEPSNAGTPLPGNTTSDPVWGYCDCGPMQYLEGPTINPYCGRCGKRPKPN
jgi:hypothetical protein